MNRLAVGAALVAAALVLGSVPAEAARHALLIGIDYRGTSSPVLYGVPFDIASMRRLLTSRLGFPADHVRVLQDGAASAQAIKAALEQLVTTTAPGDTVFIYYSGHGTSAYDKNLELQGLSPDTGALIAADFVPQPRGTPVQQVRGLVVGSRDIRPTLEHLDRGGRDVLVVFDTCYAENSARNFPIPEANPPVPRYVSMTGGPAYRPGLGQRSQIAWPYRRGVVFLAAAGADETAADERKVSMNHDGNPHGAFTNALLVGFGGAADTNRDGTVSYAELFNFARAFLDGKYTQTPQVFWPTERPDIASRAVMGAATAPPVPPRPPSPASAVRVRIDGLPSEAVAALRAIAGADVVTTGDADLMVVRRGTGAAIHHRSGDLLTTVPLDSGSFRELSTTVARHVKCAEILSLTATPQPVSLQFSIHAPLGYLRVGDVTSMEATSDVAATYLVLNIDKTGEISVIYPYDRAEATPRPRMAVNNVTILDPTGTEFVKVFAFRSKPEGYDGFIGARMDPLTPVAGRLVAMLRASAGHWSETTVKVVTQAARPAFSITR